MPVMLQDLNSINASLTQGADINLQRLTDALAVLTATSNLYTASLVYMNEGYNKVPPPNIKYDSYQTLRINADRIYKAVSW